MEGFNDKSREINDCMTLEPQNSDCTDLVRTAYRGRRLLQSVSPLPMPAPSCCWSLSVLHCCGEAATSGTAKFAGLGGICA